MAMSPPLRAGAAPRLPRKRTIAGATAVIALVLALLAALLAVAGPAAAQERKTRVVLAFLPATEDAPDPGREVISVLDRLDAREALALGLTGATQGRYEQIQAFLDITQGARASTSAYSPQEPPELEFYEMDGGALYQRWLEVRDRARDAPVDARPGFLADLVPGGTAYVGVTGRSHLEGIPAANRAGRIDEVSIGPARDIAQRAAAALRSRRFVVVGLPTGEPGGVALDRLITDHDPRDLLLVMQTPPDMRLPQLLPTGALGLGPQGGITSSTTRREGLVAGIDVLPTVLQHLGVTVPNAVKGQPMRVEGKRSASALRDLNNRLRVVGGRRFGALETLIAFWLAVVLVAGYFADRRGVRAAMRVGALAFLWVLPVLLLTAALAPGRNEELLLIPLLTFGLAFVTDRFVGWPRGPVVPGLVTMVVYGVDLIRGSDLIIRSLLGPNPRFGSRYYGLGNELESALPVLLLLALAAFLVRRPPSRWAAALVAGSGLALGVFMGAGKLGAAVGGVFTIGIGFGIATVLLLPGGFTRMRALVVIGVPAVGLLALSAIDLLSGGEGHFTRSVLRAESGSDLLDTVERRYELAYNQFKRGLMPFATALCLLAIAYAYRYRRRIFAPLGDDPAWRAALIGGAAAGVAGTLFNDSGPVLLLFATFILAIGVAYVRGDPRLAAVDLEAAELACARMGETGPAGTGSGAAPPGPDGPDR
jgi:hypothetical protein